MDFFGSYSNLEPPGLNNSRGQILYQITHQSHTHRHTQTHTHKQQPLSSVVAPPL